MDVKNLFLGLAIFILTMFVIIYGFNSFYPSPEYEKYCNFSFTRVNTSEECESLGGEWEEFYIKEGEKGGSCDLYSSCREEYDEAREDYSLKRFLILLPFAILVIILGAVFFNLESVGAGLMGGGIGTMIFGIGDYWGYASDKVRFLLSALGLFVLIFFTYWFNNKIGKRTNKKFWEKANKKARKKSKK